MTKQLTRQHPRHIFAFIAPLLALSVVLAPQPAQAGFFEWLDNATTYNEDQKRPLRQEILPKGPPAPLLYNTRKGDRWSQYHTRQDLVPVPAMDGSATMVMRPRSTQKAMLHGYVLDQNGNPIMGPNGQPITGFDVLQRRAALNKAQQNQGRLFIGEPENIPGRTEVDLGVKTRIGAPIEDWRSATPRTQFDPQPGDFDYAGNTHHSPFGHLETHTTPPKRPHNNGQQNANGAFGDHFPDHYVVQKDDTLSEISEKDRIYGDWKLWPLIYDANRNQISHPDLIYPNQTLGIPRDYTVDDASEARMHSLPPYKR